MMSLESQDWRLKSAYDGYEEAAYEFAIHSTSQYAHLSNKFDKKEWQTAERIFLQRQAHYFKLLKTSFNEENDLEDMEDRIRDLQYRIDRHPELSELSGRFNIFNTYAGFKQAGFILMGLNLAFHLGDFIGLTDNTPIWPLILGFLLILAMMPIEEYATRLNRIFHLKIKEVFPLKDFKREFRAVI